MLKSTSQTYGNAARFLHWSSAILILTMIPMGIAMTRIADGSVKSTLYLIHVNLGLVVLLLTALRVLWRFIEPSPSLPTGLSPARQWLFKAVHTGQYLFLIGLIITGIGTFMATGPLASGIPETAALTLPAAHSLLSKVFMGLLVAHLTGIVQYQLTKGDVLTRMGFPKALLKNIPAKTTFGKE